MPKKKLSSTQLSEKLTRIAALADARANLEAALAAGSAKRATQALNALESVYPPGRPRPVANAAAAAEQTMSFRFAWVDPQIPVTLHLYVNGVELANSTYHGGGVQYFQGPPGLEPNQPIKVVFGATFWHGGWRYHFDMKRLSGNVVALGNGSDPNPGNPKDDLVTIITDERA